MNNLTVLEKLRAGSFREKEEDKITIEGAVFLTYSIDCKTILSGLISMFAEEENSEERNIIECWQRLLRYGMGNKNHTSEEAAIELQEHVAFVCNEGYDKSVFSPIYWYTRDMTYYYKWTEAEGKYSFHPKLYVVKYRKNDELYFRFMIGSMNFVNSKNKEFMVTMDIPAYEEKPQDEKEYVHGHVLKELMNLDENYASKNIKNGQRLGRVVKNLGLDSCYFNREDMERIIVFPQEKEDILIPFFKEGNMSKGQQKMILSPFLSKEMLDKLHPDTRLYTMESELKKLGYVPVSAEETSDDKTRRFYVYSVNEGEKAFTHIKMYVLEDSVYVGSANFTQSALGERSIPLEVDETEKQGKQKKIRKRFGRNKEILMRLDAEPGFIAELESYLEDNYKVNLFRHEKGEAEEKGIHDKFREWIEAMTCYLQQQKERSGEGISYKSRVTVKEDKKEIWQDKITQFQKDLSIQEKKTVDVKIAPFCSPARIQSLMEGNSWEWQFLNRLKLDDSFLFFLYVDGELLVQFNYHLDTEKEGNIAKEEVMELTNNMMVCYLEQLLENKKTTSSTITKNPDDIESGSIGKDTIGYIRRSLPTLETILKRGLDKKELSLENIEFQVQNLKQLEILLSNEKEFTEEEKKLLGIDGTSKKIIENMLQQGAALLEELQR